MGKPLLKWDLSEYGVSCLHCQSWVSNVLILPRMCQSSACWPNLSVVLTVTWTQRPTQFRLKEGNPVIHSGRFAPSGATSGFQIYRRYTECGGRKLQGITISNALELQRRSDFVPSARWHKALAKLYSFLKYERFQATNMSMKVTSCVTECTCRILLSYLLRVTLPVISFNKLFSRKCCCSKRNKATLFAFTAFVCCFYSGLFFPLFNFSRQFRTMFCQISLLICFCNIPISSSKALSMTPKRTTHPGRALVMGLCYRFKMGFLKHRK